MRFSYNRLEKLLTLTLQAMAAAKISIEYIVPGILMIGGSHYYPVDNNRK